MNWINSTDLKQWAPRRNCQENLPLLIRKLIRGSAKEIKKIRFPGGDNILLSGWDGILEASDVNEYVPVGFSVWEFGADINKKGKAQKEYVKRTSNSLGINPRDSTFIFVTPYYWQDKDVWSAEKSKDGIWSDVRVYDGLTLEEWIAVTPAVGAWLGKLIGKYPHDGIQPTDNFWEEWSIGPKFNLSPEIVTAGRDSEQNRVKNFLENPPGILTVQAPSRDEAIAFIIASVKRINGVIEEDFFSRSLIVDNPNVFRILTNNLYPLILIPRFDDIGIVNYSVSKGHHIVLSLGADNSAFFNDTLTLPRLDREKFIQSLIKLGFTEDDARKYSKETSRNLTILRRQLGFQRNEPEWAKNSNIREVIPALLAGRWDENDGGDKDIISKLAGDKYEEYINKLSRWKNTQDSPIYQIATNWRLASPLDAWFHIASKITIHDFENLRRVCLEVLNEIDPSLELEPEKRFMKSLYDKEFNYSSWLREGLCQSLIMISVFGEALQVTIPINAQVWVDLVITDLLENSDSKKWISLNSKLPLIAEASPSSFLSAVENNLKEPLPGILGMFEEVKSLLTPDSYHTGLLWALEGLAWFPDLLTRVTLILARLSHLDPGGHLANRPMASLREIFLAWHPNTYGNLQHRLDALNALVDKQPEIAFDLLISLLPKIHDISNPTYKTRWRKFNKEKDTNTSYSERLKFYSSVVELLLINCNNDEQKLAQICNNLDTLPFEDREKVLEYIKNNADSIKQNTYAIWYKLKYILYRHRSYKDKHWTLLEGELIKIENVFTKLTPKDLINKNIWLFNEHWPHLPEGVDFKKVSHEDHEKIIQTKRKEAFNEIYFEKGISEILALTTCIEKPEVFGDIAGQCIIDEKEINKIFELLKKGNKKELSFIDGFTWRKQLIFGLDWIKERYNHLVEENYSNEEIARIFIPLNQTRELLDFLETTENPEIINNYWSNIYPRFYDLPDEYIIFGLQKLQSAKRHIMALDISSHFLKKIPSDLIINILECAATNPSIEQNFLDGYEIESLFEELDMRSDCDINRIPRLEWLYLPYLLNTGSGRKTKLLFKELSKNPEFFIEVIKWIYKPQNEMEIESDIKDLDPELIQQRAENGWKLLYDWNIVPGTDDKNNINESFLIEWISTVRELSEKCRRPAATDIEIGKILAKYPKEITSWPPEPICKLIDRINSVYINDAFYDKIIDSRGVVTKSFSEGGEQELGLAEYYIKLSAIISSKYPVTASLLEKVSKYYQLDSKNEDYRAEKTNLEY